MLVPLTGFPSLSTALSSADRSCLRKCRELVQVMKSVTCSISVVPRTYLSFMRPTSVAQGITAVLNLQRKSEQDNWGIDGEAIERLAREKGLFVVNFPIRYGLEKHGQALTLAREYLQ